MWSVRPEVCSIHSGIYVDLRLKYTAILEVVVSKK